YASVSNASMSLWNGVTTATVSGEVRSNGVFNITGSAQLNLSVPLIGIGLNTSLTVSVSRATPNGAFKFTATGTGGVYLYGVELAGASVSINQSGHVTITYVAFGVTAPPIEFDL